MVSHLKSVSLLLCVFLPIDRLQPQLFDTRGVARRISVRPSLVVSSYRKPAKFCYCLVFRPPVESTRAAPLLYQYAHCSPPSSSGLGRAGGEGRVAALPGRPADGGGGGQRHQGGGPAGAALAEEAAAGGTGAQRQAVRRPGGAAGSQVPSCTPPLLLLLLFFLPLSNAPSSWLQSPVSPCTVRPIERGLC